MKQTKDNLINELVISLADNCNLPISELKQKLQMELYDWNCQRIETTELSIKNGEVTKELLRYFEIGKLGSNKSKETIVQYERVAIQLCDLVDKELNMITTDDVKYFLVMYKQIHGVSDYTMEYKRLCLSSIFTYLYKNKQINDNPMDRVEPVSHMKKVKQALTDEELERIILACKDNRREIAMIYFLVNTGVRVSELAGLKLRDVDFDRKRALVLGKRSKQRYVYFDSRTKVRLMDYIEHDRKDVTFENGRMIYSSSAPLIASEKGGYHAIKKNAIERIIRNIGEKSMIMRIHPHLFRATYATNMLKKGVDIQVIAKLLGHSKVETTSLYVCLSDDEMEQIAGSL